jgi:hypothetical protein
MVPLSRNRLLDLPANIWQTLKGCKEHSSLDVHYIKDGKKESCFLLSPTAYPSEIPDSALIYR